MPGAAGAVGGAVAYSRTRRGTLGARAAAGHEGCFARALVSSPHACGPQSSNRCVVSGSLNFSQFVEGRRWWPWAREGREAAYVFAGDEPCTGEEIGCASASIDELQTNGMDPPPVHVTAYRARWLCEH